VASKKKLLLLEKLLAKFSGKVLVTIPEQKLFQDGLSLESYNTVHVPENRFTSFIDEQLGRSDLNN
jgi:hypothetical protein